MNTFTVMQNALIPGISVSGGGSFALRPPSRSSTPCNLTGTYPRAHPHHHHQLLDPLLLPYQSSFGFSATVQLTISINALKEYKAITLTLPHPFFIYHWSGLVTEEVLFPLCWLSDVLTFIVSLEASSPEQKGSVKRTKKVIFCLCNCPVFLLAYFGR